MKISKFFQATALCAGVLMLMGCPYTSSVPLSAANTKAPDYLIGDWELSGSEGDKLEIKRLEGNLLDISKISSGEYGSTEHYQAYVTQIDNTLFLNLWEVSEYDDSKSYYFYKIEKIGDNKIVAYAVTENIRETFNDSKSIYDFFVKNMKNSYFYDSGEETYYKIK